MDERDARLAAFALATLHVSLLVGGLVLLSYSKGASPLADLGTWPGVLAFLWLWGVATWTTREGSKGLLRGDAPPREVLPTAMFWGGITGVGFLVGVGLASALATREPAAVFALAFGSFFALAIGGFVGLAAGLLDLALLALVRRAAPTP